MDRRTFLGRCSAAGGAWWVGQAFGVDEGAAQSSYVTPVIFPQPPPVKRLVTVPLSAGLSWEENVLFTCLQGLLNRESPSVYFVLDKTDAYWLDHYRARFGFPVEELSGPWALLERFRERISGFSLYDSKLLDTANLATVQCGLTGMLPASEALAKRLEAGQIPGHHDLRGRWSDRYEVYRHGLDELLPQCYPHLLGATCADMPHWPAAYVWFRDYLVAHQIFTCDLSASLRDRADRALLIQIFERMKAPGCVIGWRCIRCSEHEHVALAAQYGFSKLNFLLTRNMTIHAAMPRPEQPLHQIRRPVAGASSPAPRVVAASSPAPQLSRKVYIALMNTDGDAIPAMLERMSGRFDDPEHGDYPYSWGILPLAVDLMPAVLEHLYASATPNDYFVAATSGALYTYPHLRPDEEDYLRFTRYYLQRAGLDTAYMANWQDEFWTQEVDLPRYIHKLRRNLPECIGFVRGMGESAFERDYLGGGAPYLYCGEGIHRDSDVYDTFNKFIAANPIRPLFIFCLSNHNVTMGRIKEGIDRLPEGLVELVHLDKLMNLVREAHQRGWIQGNTLYPDKSGLRKLLREEALLAWPGKRDEILERAALAEKPEAEYSAGITNKEKRVIVEHSATSLSDLVAFDAIWDSMSLVKLALNARGIYVNEKRKGVRDFMREFSEWPEAGVVRECWRAWERWEGHPLIYDEACTLAEGLGKLAKRVDEGISPQENVEDPKKQDKGRRGEQQ
ncbi:MAG: hypothetical protein HYV26_13270 [Candidatus Hydrogenedentes bacterium]|nr:hypothetical protein [Candidatus Hydrogenedentota bacterium]